MIVFAAAAVFLRTPYLCMRVEHSKVGYDDGYWQGNRQHASQCTKRTDKHSGIRLWRHITWKKEKLQNVVHLITQQKHSVCVPYHNRLWSSSPEPTKGRVGSN